MNISFNRLIDANKKLRKTINELQPWERTKLRRKMRQLIFVTGLIKQFERAIYNQTHTP